MPSFINSWDLLRLISTISGGSRVASELDSGAEGPGFKSQPRKVMAAYRRVYDSHHLPADCKTGISSGRLRWTIEYGQPLPCLLLRFITVAASVAKAKSIGLVSVCPSVYLPVFPATAAVLAVIGQAGLG